LFLLKANASQIDTGFKDFMTTIANNTARDSIYGTAIRVGLGALLSSIDTVTDVYVISTYYRSDDLVFQANALLAMIKTNLVVQSSLCWDRIRRKTGGSRRRRL